MEIKAHRVRNNSERTMWRSPLTCDGDTAEAQPPLDIQHIFDRMLRGQHDRIGDKAVFVTLYGSDHGCLRLWGLIVMDDTNSA